MTKRVEPEIGGKCKVAHWLDDPLISGSENEEEDEKRRKARDNKSKINTTKPEEKKPRLPSFAQLAASATQPKFLTKKKAPDFVTKILANPTPLAPAPPPPPVVLAKEPEEEKEPEKVPQPEEKSYEDALKQIESSNKIYKKIDKKEKYKKGKERIRFPRKPPTTQRFFDSETHYRLTHSLED